MEEKVRRLAALVEEMGVKVRQWQSTRQNTKDISKTKIYTEQLEQLEKEQEGLD